MSTEPEPVTATAVEKVADADFPCRFGDFRILGFRVQGHRGGGDEIVALKMGDFQHAERPPLVRIHSQCLTGEVFHSLRCDCGQQLDLALRKIAEEGLGLLIYDPQEGRGIGLLNKLQAYQLQDEGADTVEANEQLGFGADERNYDLPIAILHYLNLRRVRFLSNNPAKVQALEKAGIEVTERVSCEIPSSGRTADYLRTKKEKLGHLLEGI